MKKKVLIGGGIVLGLVVIGLAVLFAIPWGEYESTLVKSEIIANDTTSAEIKVPSFNNLDGAFNVNSEESENAEILFQLDGLKNTKGAFEKFTVQLSVSNSVESASFDVTIDAASINTGNEMRDEHLVEEDFFNVKTYPQIVYESSAITWNEGIYTAKGTLTLLETTKELSFDFKHIGSGQNKNKVDFEAFEGEFVFDRTAYGMTEESGVGNEVTLSFYLELVK